MADTPNQMNGPLIPRNRAIHPVPYDPAYKTSVARSPSLPLLSLESTPTEETGPTFGHNRFGALDNNLILNWTKGASHAVGERILMHGRVLVQEPATETDRKQGAGDLRHAWGLGAGLGVACVMRA